MRITRRELRRLITEEINLLAEAISAPPPDEVKGAKMMKSWLRPGQSSYWAGGEVRRYIKRDWEAMTPEQQALQWADLERK